MMLTDGLCRGRALEGCVMIVIAGSCLFAGCSGDHDHDWGPPSGYARVDGRVTYADGTPGPKDMEVALTRCGSPVGGLAGSSRTAAGGTFSVEGSLAPIDLFPQGSDSLKVQCELIAGQGFATSGPLDVYFFRRSREPTVLHVDLKQSL